MEESGDDSNEHRLSNTMIINAKRGKDIEIFATTHVTFRFQGHQIRVAASNTGIVTLDGKWTRPLNYYGNRKVIGEVWIGKERHILHIAPK